VETGQEVPIILNGVNIELTDSLIDHVNKRIGKTLSRLANNGAVKECDVLLSVTKNPKVRRRSCSKDRGDRERLESIMFPSVVFANRNV
jgi:ribosome-associated translation inhibitor RaiA